MIEVVNVNKTFGEKHVLKDINATFDEGKVNMIIGRSGSGKTVLLKNIVGLVTPETGEIYFNGREFVNVDEKAKREIRKEMGMVFQGSALFTSNNVEENVMLPLDLFTKMTKAEKQKRVDFCLDRVGIVNSHHDASSHLALGDEASHHFINLPFLLVPGGCGIKEHLPIVHVEHITRFPNSVTIGQPHCYIATRYILRLKVGIKLQTT